MSAQNKRIYTSNMVKEKENAVYNVYIEYYNVL